MRIIFVWTLIFLFAAVVYVYLPAFLADRAIVNLVSVNAEKARSAKSWLITHSQYRTLKKLMDAASDSAKPETMRLHAIDVLGQYPYDEAYTFLAHLSMSDHETSSIKEAAHIAKIRQERRIKSKNMTIDKK